VKPTKDQLCLMAAAFLRALGVGLMGVVLAVYLSKRGLRVGEVGLVIASGLCGLAAGTFWVGLWADRVGRRHTLSGLALLTALGGWGLAFFPNLAVLVLLAFFGMVNAMGRERGGLFALEQAILSGTADGKQRTFVLAWYNLILDVGMGIGSLMGELPAILHEKALASELGAYRWVFLLYAGFSLGGWILYLSLSDKVEVNEADRLPVGLRGWRRMESSSRKVIVRLSLLFGFDSLAGGFLPTTLVAYWFFQRFGTEEGWLASFFFVAHLMNAPSYLVSAWLARRIGLVNTMVFTHIPAQLMLIAIPFSPTLTVATVLYLMREFLVEMDVPTRQSYLMALVKPEERTLASGVTNLTRQMAWALGSLLAGYVMQGLALSGPFFLTGGLKIVYDILLYTGFRKVKPP